MSIYINYKYIHKYMNICRYTISICIGHLEFVEEQCSSGKNLEGHGVSNVSPGIPCHEIHIRTR
jgi:hypothetical protein